MKFKIDRRYVSVQSLKAIAGYVIGLLFVIYCLDIAEPWEFVWISFFAFIVSYFILIYPRNIVVEDGAISFVKENGFIRRKIKLADISDIELCCKRYNTLTLTTMLNRNYNLHPQKAQELEILLRDSR